MHLSRTFENSNAWIILLDFLVGEEFVSALDGCVAMQVLLDGCFILKEYGGSIAVFFVTVLGMGVWFSRYLPFARENNLMIIPLGLGIGMLPLAMFSFGLILLARFWPPLLNVGSICITIWAVMILGFELCRNHHLRIGAARTGLIILAGLVFLLFLIGKLSFLRYILLPPYDDSPEHYMVVRDFISPNGIQAAFYSLGNLSDRYYHFGFHSLAAWLISVSGLELSSAIALLGQLLLVISPLSIFFFTAAVTNDYKAASFAALLSGVGWKMPAYASNWGKYPAIAAAAIMPALFGFLYLCWRRSDKKPILLVSMLLLSVGAIFFHTRVLVCLLLAVLSYGLARWISPQRNFRFWEAIALVVATIALMAPLWDSMVGFYCGYQCFVLGLVLLLSAYVFQTFPCLALWAMFFSIGIYLAYRLPLPAPLHFYSRTWLDQPFVDTLFFIPLSIAGGGGLAGLLQKLKNRGAWLRGSLGILFVGLVLLNSAISHSYYPDRCCNYVKEGDLHAIQWLGENTPEDAVIIIPGFRSRNYMIGTDAGVWVHTLTKRNANKKPYNLAWDKPNVLQKICQSGFDYIYVYGGAMTFSFDKNALKQQEWYQPVFRSGGTTIYQVKGCNRYGE